MSICIERPHLKMKRDSGASRHKNEIEKGVQHQSEKGPDFPVGTHSGEISHEGQVLLLSEL